MSYLHEKSICHGDLYAHNVLVDGETGTAVLCDFGASFFYPSDMHDTSVFEGTEVRAFGLMARDMACRSAGCEWILQVRGGGRGEAYWIGLGRVDGGRLERGSMGLTLIGFGGMASLRARKDRSRA